MTRYPMTATRGMSARRALELMREHEIRHLPIVDEGSVVGVVSERDLAGFRAGRELALSHFMATDPYVARLDTPLSEVAAAMAAEKFGCTVVLDEQERVAGIFTTTDALVLLSRLLKEREKESRDPTRPRDEFARYMDEWIEWDSSWGE
jgi:acetoin utilization protein AcuB